MTTYGKILCWSNWWVNSFCLGCWRYWINMSIILKCRPSWIILLMGCLIILENKTIIHQLEENKKT